VPELLFEIGCEEIPAGYLAQALPELERRGRQELGSAKLIEEGAPLGVLGTPRRLALVAREVRGRQPDVDETLVGPPTSAGSKAKDGFARKYGLLADDIAEEDTDKGRRFVAKRHITGQDARAILPELLARLITEISWPKSMRWGAHPETFVRPLHWILAILGGEVVPVTFAGVRSGRSTRGHRFLARAPFEVASVDDWQKGLRSRFVVVDPAERRQLVEAEIARLERETELSVRPDPALVAEVTNLVEYPVGVSGSFDPAFLEVPEPVVVSAMRGHQRYFAMMGRGGKITNRFLTIAGTVVKDAKTVAHGNERVLRARLSDARFFFDEDRKVPLEARAEKLSGIVWVKQLGTMAEKAFRVTALAKQWAPKVGAAVEVAERAARLCKADLLTHLVGEFPDLQGTIGSAYARAAGESAEVADAIAEHYQPRGAQDKPAPSTVGALLAIVDRVDTLVGCFGVGLEPTGSADPYGLRRAAIGILSTLLAQQWHLSLRELCESAAAHYQLKLPEIAKTGPGVAAFLKVRLRGLLAEDAPADVVDAVLEADADDPVDARARARALGALRPQPDFEPLGVAIKRVGNILKGQRDVGAVDSALFADPAERELHRVAGELGRDAQAAFGQRDYGQALRVLSGFKAPVDAFFDQVFVMAEDPKVRQNRLALLGEINHLFLRIADFQKLDLG
jgi:glycyl-tRNA synthetase beta chain